MPVTYVRKDYLLSEAFELIGRRLFGDEWTGHELFAAAAKSPEQMRADREPLVAAMRGIENGLAEIDRVIATNLSADVISEAEARRQALFDRRIEVMNELLRHPEPAKSHLSDFGNFQRRQHVERVLIDALGRRLVNSHDGRLRPIDNLLWQGHPHFGFDIELSVVRMPRNQGGRRFQPARVFEREFDEWLLKLSPLTPSAEQFLEPIEQCRRLIRRWAEASGGTQQKSKGDYCAEAIADIPRLTERAFESAWAQVAPPEWRRFGRRRWQKNPPRQC